ncbi:flavin reductase [Novosphingobium umbonatum]|uniref:Flavin reductase n=1 Tax=Novosphingobium umbonatum TaxID=1908524 RepID=A0A3S2X238_9SPHN|nr:flavin reductase family protein [Novosphingobium umbonatum]RVU03713.1 flavin reductase [Novosphingobium umbonatum]
MSETAKAIDPAQFRQVLGHYPTGVAAITSLDANGQPLVMIVGTFTSVSLDPPLVGFLPTKTSASWAAIAATGRFAVNVLGLDQGALCGQLAGRGDKWAGVEYRLGERNVPLLAGALVTIECDIAGTSDAGDHDFVLGAVRSLEVGREGDPLLYYRGSYGTFTNR